MAILTCLPGLEVAVEADGQRAHEYDADPEEVESRAEEISFHRIQQTHRRRRHGNPYVLKYIEAKPGKPFAFIFDMMNCHDFSTGPNIHYTCVMDGFCTGTKRVSSGTRDKRYYCQTGSQAAGWKKHEFRFGSLNVLEGGDGTQAEKAKQYGTLLVKLFLAVETGRLEAPSDRDGPTLIHSVHEKDLKGKAVDSKVSFDSEPIANPPPFRMRDFVDPYYRPIAVFEFRYRTMCKSQLHQGLIQEAIVSRPTPVPDEVIDAEEEYKEPENDASRGIKREAPMDDALFAARYKQRRLENGKIEIDLTDD
ncbi:hypothetical protein B0H65DRAFT_439406 [Neurospora tetraspora]|uniref:DUF7918 domain-containing protein n=1 Tax=Neurospora tetraspora TaxID=94610 RepID=A0AAE0MX67_9PEZI|nr:hypothetical protein B0H65DRAFT_439406 [Neurospora tetraspora]